MWHPDVSVGSSKTKYSHIPGCFWAWTCHLYLTSAQAFAVYCHRKVSGLFWVAVPSRGANWDPVVRHIGAFSEWLSHEGGMAIMLLVLRPSSDICAALRSVDILFNFPQSVRREVLPKGNAHCLSSCLSQDRLNHPLKDCTSLWVLQDFCKA